MKKLLLGSALSFAMAAGASAADLPPRPAPAPVYSKAPMPVWSWTGCYVGGNVGGGWSRISASDPTIVVPVDLGTINGSGVVGGGQVGCDYQFSGPWVIGVQGMFDAASIKGSTVVPGTLGLLSVDSKIPWIATATARLGYAVSPAALLYVKGGGAWSRDNLGLNFDGFGTVATATDNRSGWTVGGGVEYKFWSNVSLFVEYDYLDFGTKTTTFVAVAPPFVGTAPVSIKENIQEVLVGLNFRFGGGPVIAKY
jgi:outer membrane immunogenic protein